MTRSGRHRLALVCAGSMLGIGAGKARPLPARLVLETRGGPDTLVLSLKWEHRARPKALQVVPSPEGLRITLRPTPGQLRDDVRQTGDALLPLVTATASRDEVVVGVPWTYPLPFEAAEGKDDLTVTLRKTFVRVASRSLIPGVVLLEEEVGREEGRHRNVLVVANPGAAHLRLLNRQGSRLESTGNIARRHQPIAAVNGGYFSPRDGFALGLVQQDERILSGPIHARTALHLAGKNLSVARASVQPWILLPGGESAEVDQVNVLPAAADGLSLFREPWSNRSGTRGDNDSLELAVSRDGVVLGVGQRDMGLPPGGWVVHARGVRANWLAARARRGTVMNLHEPTREFWGLDGDALGAGPELVRDGQVQISQEERFRADIMRGRHARTAVGIGRDGRIILLTTAQDRAGDLGMSLEEAAATLVRWGAWQGLNLDGGTSTTLWTPNGTLVGQRPERPVANALGLFPGTSGAVVQEPMAVEGTAP
ncbi:MAG: phosphodiester glycosidase family protein [Candidatus Sericytochromatia bacterium]|nr:phosphodiester glycosidase family protein [Candidatus Sericytochromatia bacterium]